MKRAKIHRAGPPVAVLLGKDVAVQADPFRAHRLGIIKRLAARVRIGPMETSDGATDGAWRAGAENVPGPVQAVYMQYEPKRTRRVCECGADQERWRDGSILIVTVVLDDGRSIEAAFRGFDFDAKSKRREGIRQALEAVLHRVQL